MLSNGQPRRSLRSTETDHSDDGHKMTAARCIQGVQVTQMKSNVRCKIRVPIVPTRGRITRSSSSTDSPSQSLSAKSAHQPRILNMNLNHKEEVDDLQQRTTFGSTLLTTQENGNFSAIRVITLLKKSHWSSSGTSLWLKFCGSLLTLSSAMELSLASHLFISVAFGLSVKKSLQNFCSCESVVLSVDPLLADSIRLFFLGILADCCFWAMPLLIPCTMTLVGLYGPLLIEPTQICWLVTNMPLLFSTWLGILLISIRDIENSFPAATLTWLSFIYVSVTNNYDRIVDFGMHIFGSYFNWIALPVMSCSSLALVLYLANHRSNLPGVDIHHSEADVVEPVEWKLQYSMSSNNSQNLVTSLVFYFGLRNILTSMVVLLRVWIQRQDKVDILDSYITLSLTAAILIVCLCFVHPYTLLRSLLLLLFSMFIFLWLDSEVGVIPSIIFVVASAIQHLLVTAVGTLCPLYAGSALALSLVSYNWTQMLVYNAAEGTKHIMGWSFNSYVMSSAFAAVDNLWSSFP